MRSRVGSLHRRNSGDGAMTNLARLAAVMRIGAPALVLLALAGVLAPGGAAPSAGRGDMAARLLFAGVPAAARVAVLRGAVAPSVWHDCT